MTAFTVGKEAFTRAVTRAVQGIPQRPVRPVYAGMHILAGVGPAGPGVELTGSDGEIMFRAHCAAEVKEAGSVVVPGRMLGEVCRYLTGNEISLTLDGTRLRITAGRSEFSLMAVSGENYPQWAPRPPLALGTLHADLFAGGVRKTVPAASRTEVELGVMLLALGKGGTELTLMCTNRSSMAVTEMRFDLDTEAVIDAGGELPARAIIPVRVMDRFARIAEDTIKIGWNTSLVTLACDGVEVTAQQMSSKFWEETPWEKALMEPAGFVTAAEDMIRAVRMASLVAGDAQRIEITFEPGGMTIMSGDPEGKCEEWVDSSYTGEPARFAFGSQMLLDGLAGCGDTPQVTHRPGMVMLSGEGLRWVMRARRDVDGTGT